MSSENQDKTNRAILDQLVYIDNFIGEGNDLDFDLSAFADDSFVFADEEKPHNDKVNDLLKDPSNNAFSPANLNGLELNNLPRFPVPPGAKNSLQQAGLNQTQIDLLSALIAQYQLVQKPQDLPHHLHHDVLHSLHQELPQNSPEEQLTQAAIKLEDRPYQSESWRDGPSSASPDMFNLFSQAPQLQHSQYDESLILGPAAPPAPPSTSSSTSGTEKSIDNDLDKRRRNTAASARFRIKKKLKEKQMEEKIENLQDLIKNFESKIQTLEMENKLLKNLIFEKGSEKLDQELKKFKERVLKDNS